MSDYGANVELIEESLLITAMKIMPADGNFKRALDIGDSYKQAGLTPCYFLDWDQSLIRVTTEEKLKGMYN